MQRVMNNILKELQGLNCLIYMVEIVILLTSLPEHLVNLNKSISTTSISINGTMHLNKSEFIRKEVVFSKYGQVESATSGNVLRNILIFLTHHGIPKIMVSNNETEFKNGLIQDFIDTHEILIN